MASAVGITEFRLIGGDLSEAIMKTGRKAATLSVALARYDDLPKTPIVLLSQRCTQRGQSICTAKRSITHLVAYATDGINAADFKQLLGRGTGRGFVGDVVCLTRRECGWRLA